MIPRRHLTREKHDETLVTITHQCEDYERCESMELDDKIRDLIAGSPEATASHRNVHAPKEDSVQSTAPMPPCPQPPMQHASSIPLTERTLGKTASLSSQDMAGLSVAGAYMENNECVPPRRKDLTNSLELKIKHLEKQRQELLDVNQQWDQQFRNMKEFYERKVLELKNKLAATENTHTLEKEQKQSLTEGNRQLEKEKDSLRKELQALKKENKLLKENNALANRKKEHYVCEINRLNKVPEQVKQEMRML
ncbi:TNFAIP3-interacting protein 3 [Apodemus speciosus]|uniref:TNFAIP3-interacting protein 3 n=1 Tax=Apodemus speciosus TaxID=105296 RepID=A0ABQ0EVR4_APOSI